MQTDCMWVPQSPGTGLVGGLGKLKPWVNSGKTVGDNMMQDCASQMDSSF